MSEHFTYSFASDLTTPSLLERLRAATPWKWSHDATTEQISARAGDGLSIAIGAVRGGKRVLTLDLSSNSGDAQQRFYAALEIVFEHLLPSIERRPSDASSDGEFVHVPGGRFLIGLTATEVDELSHELARMEVTILDEREEPHGTVDEIAARRREFLQLSTPAHEVEVGELYMARYPVTVAEYARFVTETGAAEPITWKRGRPPEAQFVTGVSWSEAAAYAEYQGAALPTEAEWERAARNGRSFFTWGNDYFPAGRIAFPEDAINAPWPVGSRPELASIHGIHDLLGPFGEFTADVFTPYPGSDTTWFDQRFPRWRTERAVRGGWDSQQDSTTVFRSTTGEDERTRIVKIRLVRRAVR